MLVVAILLLVVAVGLGVLLARTSARLGAVSDDLDEAIQAREAADAARRSAEADAAEARKERDDALERANRARRDAADVAKRMKREADARADAEAARTEAEAARAQAEAAASGGVAQAAGQAAELWALALDGVRRTWEVSVAPSPGMPCPLDGSDDELRDAVAIEVDAAREEAGAAIELEWSGDVVSDPSVAVRTLALAREVIGRLAKTTDAAVLQVSVTRDAVTLQVTGTDLDGRPAPVEALLADVAGEQQVAPGRFEVAPAKVR